MLSIKTLALAAALSAGAVLALPAGSEAMPQSTPVPQGIAKDGNVVNVNHRKRRERQRRWRQYCSYADDWRCERRSRHYRHRYYENRYYDPGYGDDGYYYRPRYREPGIGLQFRID